MSFPRDYPETAPLLVKGPLRAIYGALTDSPQLLWRRYGSDSPTGTHRHPTRVALQIQVKKPYSSDVSIRCVRSRS
jgi:hypothetical protein